MQRISRRRQLESQAPGRRCGVANSTGLRQGRGVARINLPMNEADQIEAGIAALQAQRTALGDAVVDTALVSLHLRLAVLRGQELDQQLKQVTVLFTDIVDSTSLSQRLDPEDIHAVVNNAMERFTAIVAAHRGRVLQYAGDGLLAVFGADVAREDDAECAVHAGLALLAEGAHQGKEVRLRHGHDGFNVRVGIHTGAVLLGGGVDAEGSIRGLAVNIAARMEQTAPTGCLRISHDTYAQVRGVFDVALQPALQIKGRDEPVVTYLVQAAKPRAFRRVTRGVEGVETRMVGRDAELARLKSTFESVAKDRELAWATLVAEAGLGKSRLMAEFEHWIELRPEAIRLFRGRGQPQGENQPYGVLRDMLCWRFQIQDSDAFGDANGKLADALGRVFGARAEEQTALVGQLMGLDNRSSPYIAGIVQDGKQIRDRAFHALSQFFRGLCGEAGGPVLLLLDDLHWGDAGSLDFVNHLAKTCADLPLMLLCATRPGLYERRPLWGSGERHHQRIDLLPLPRRDRRELAEALLQRIDNPPQMLRELITGDADGNPFYMEELMQMLIDDGAIVVGPDRWRVVTDKLVGTRLPATLTAVLQARLDALPPREKASLQPASVIGHVFWDEALANLSADAVHALPALARRDVAHGRETSAFEGTREYVFKHHLLHQVTYESVLKRHKRAQHKLTAMWLVTRSGARLAEHASLIADHFERAGEAADAAHYWHRAAEHAWQRFALDAALSHADRSLALGAGDDPLLRYALTLLRCEVLAKLPAREAQAVSLDALEQLADGLDDDLKRSQAAERRAAFLITGGEFAASLPVAKQALAWSAGREPSVEARALNAMTLATARLGQYAVAKEHAQAGLVLARASGDTAAHANLLQNMGLVLYETGDPIGAATYMEQALGLCRTSGDRFGECRVLNSLSDMCRSVGDYRAARTQMLESVRLCKAVGVRVSEGYAHLNLALVMLNLGEPAQALDHALGAGAILREVGDRWAETSAWVNVGHAHLALGEFASATAEFTAARERFDSLDGSHMALEPMAGLAAVALAQGDTATAVSQVESILARLAAGASLDGTNEPLRVRLSCYEALHAVHDPRAAEVLRLAHAELQQRADKISDARIRNEFLRGVPYHRAIVEAWEARSVAL